MIKETEDLVLVLRFGRENDTACLQLDNIVSSLCLDQVDVDFFFRFKSRASLGVIGSVL